MKKERPIITLTSDWGTRDYYVGTVKGTLLKHIPDVNIIDISHEIEPYDIIQAAFVNITFMVFHLIIILFLM